MTKAKAALAGCCCRRLWRHTLKTPPVPPSGAACLLRSRRKRGNDAYQASCSGCHGSDLHATDPEAVDLTGPAIRAKWNGKTLQDRFETIRDTMPPGNANTLGDKTYMDILAFILQSNEFPAGNQELAPETAKAIVFAQKP